MKKLMILGASYSQLPLYEAARKLGVYTIAASTPGDWPGFKAADACSYTDISDPEAVLQAARKFGIDGITTCCLDTGVRAIGYVCESTGLRGLSEQAGRISSDKYLMKEAFAQGGVNCARHICIKNEKELREALEKLCFPVILKAVDLMGSRGLYKCRNAEEAFLYYKETMAATGKDYCLVEEFIEGKILGCEAMMKDGELLYCLPNNIEAFDSHVPTPVGHSVPYKKADILGGEVLRQVKLAIAAVGLDNCPVNCDLLEKDGEIYVIEITGRAGATCLPEMVSLYYGINYYEAMVRLALDMNVEEMFAGKITGRPNLSRTLTSDRNGIIKEIHNANPDTPGLSGISFEKPPKDGIVDISFNVCPGEQIRLYKNGRDRIGQVILAGDTLVQCENLLKNVLSKINIEFIE